METTTGFLPAVRRTSSWISWDGAITPPGLSTRNTTAFISSSPASSRSASTVGLASRMKPRSSTTPMRSPRGRAD